MHSNNNNFENDRIEELLNQYFDGEISIEGFRELEKLLMDDEANRQRYLEKAAITGGLMNWAIEDNSRQINLERLKQLAESKGTNRFGLPNVSVDLPTNIWIALGLLVCVGVAAYFGTLMFNSATGSDSPVVAENAGDRVQREADSVDSLFAARICMVSDDLEWGVECPDEFLMRLKRGDFVTISCGKALIEFASGAQLALFGPAKIKVLDVDAARLEIGRVRGYADGGNFRLATPTADIIDLGTEFGVSIDGSANVHVSLFKGSVDVLPAGTEKLGDHDRSVRLDVEGTGATIANDGTVQRTKIDDAADFEWTIKPRNNADAMIGAVSLVDVVAGGDGLQQRIAGAINPITGEVDRRPTPRKQSDRFRQDSHPGEFKRNFSSKFLDGAFITRRKSYSYVNSHGDTFEFDRNEGRTLGPIWSRSNVAHRIQSGTKDDFWGTQTLPPIISVLEEAKLGVLGIHPNAGITFDLEALRRHHSQSLTKFSGALRNLDNSLEVVSFGRNISSANFRVIVDGDLRFEKLKFGKSDGEIAITVELDASDRFLTLVSTDAGNSTNFDRVVVVDPVLLSK